MEDIAPIPESWMDLFCPPEKPRKPRPPIEPRPLNGDTSPYAARALEDEVEQVRTAPEGVRNDTLNRASFSLGQLVAGGELHEHEVEDRLTDAALAAGLGEREARRTIGSGLRAGTTEPRQAPDPPSRRIPGAHSAGSSQEPSIQISARINEVVDQAEWAIDADPTVELYQRARVLVRVIRVTSGSARSRKGLVRTPGTPVIDLVPEAHLQECMSRSADWQRLDKRTGQCASTLPPKWAVQALAARAEWRFPRLEGLAETPFMRTDGSIADQPGYDPATGVLLDIEAGAFPRVPAEPSIEDAREALKVLLEPVADFPFVSLTDKSAALAPILTLLARPAIDGPCPMFAIRATAPGTGKSLLADVMSTIATGRVAARMTSPRDDEESRKRILAVGLESLPIVLIDNVDTVLGSQSLAAALTSTVFSDRLLGLSKTVTVPLRAVWLATGNQLRFKGDVGRRVVPIDLDAGVEHPEDRDGFRHENLVEWVREHRGELVSAALTILRAYHVAGRPKHGKPPKGSFEEWDALVRSALVWATAEDPLEGCERVRADADADLEALREALRVWFAECGTTPLTAAEVIERAKDGTDLQAALSSLSKCNPSRLSTRRLGYALRGHEGRIASGLSFHKNGMTRTGVAQWAVRAKGEA